MGLVANPGSAVQSPHPGKFCSTDLGPGQNNKFKEDKVGKGSGMKTN